MRKGRRRRRASLRGWWRALPFTLGAGALFLIFSWLHTQLLSNEYRSIELTAEIQRVKDRIAGLRGERFELGSLERMQEYAPRHFLIEPKPGQVQIVRPTADELSAIASAGRPSAKPERMTRSVVVILRKAGESTPETATPATAMAQRDETHGAVGGGTL